MGGFPPIASAVCFQIDPCGIAPSQNCLSKAALLAIALAVLIVVFLPGVRRRREEVFVEEA
ncbi:hypothetical protein ACCC98_11655 [Rhizobium pisi]|uniref:hypothetical protein n=1 Tax=Rhizobium pisi TaxID=574561 RepID=UPI0039AFFB9C